MGGGGVFLWSKNGNSGVEGGVSCEIPSVVGVWIFSGTTHSDKFLRVPDEALAFVCLSIINISFLVL